MAQLGQGGIGHAQDGWLAAPDKFALFGFLKTLFGTGYVWIVFVILFLAGFAVSRQIKFNKRTVLLLVLFFVNFFIIYFYSICKAPIFQYSVMLFSAPCFIWAVTGILKFNPKISTAILTLVSGILIYRSVVGKRFFTNAVLNQTGFQSEVYVDMEDEYGRGKVEAYFMGAQNYFVILHELKYGRKFNYHTGEDLSSIADFKKQVKNSNARFVILGEPNETQFAIVKEYFPNVFGGYESLNVNTYFFSKDKIKTQLDNQFLKERVRFPETKAWEFVYKKESMQNNIYNVDSLNEFCFSAKKALQKLDLKEGNIIFAKVKVKSKELLKDVSFNYSISNEKDSTLFFGGPELAGFYTSDSTGYYAYSEIFIGSELKSWLQQNAKVTFFIWNRGRKNFSLNDFEIKTIDYWPERWKWWD